MKPLFTVHAGEYLLGSHIEACYPKWNVWFPSKDTGIDLLITNGRNTKSVSVQVKYSKDFNPTQRPALIQHKLAATGWWTHQESKIRNSRADFWVFVLTSFTDRETNFIIVTPKELLRRLNSIHGTAGKRIQSYLWITKSKHCWEARNLRIADQQRIAFDEFNDQTRDFTPFLNAWNALEQRLRK